ncbi:MAG: enoyl-CoA hydratase/isomerase family protein [Minwuia sp.]|uniref:enoyl-CoA hydratase/isomerase family protein n=1 Tax=Minwuia sp. TaxID=2493630 RepID=UPI003A873339
MDWEFCSVERSGRIVTVRFDRGYPANPMSDALMKELTDLARWLDEDLETSVVVLTGRSDNFSMGFDLKEGRDPDASLLERRRAVQRGPRLCRAWEDLEQMTICAIEGWCVGGGVALATALDLRVMGEGSTLYVSEIERGMNMSWNSVPRFVNLCGPARTKRLVVMAERVGAEQAKEWGLADELTPKGGAFDKAMVMAERIASLPPVQVRMLKKDVDVAAKALNHAVSFMDADQFVLSQTSEDYREGVESFLEKRPPNYTGR